MTLQQWQGQPMVPSSFQPHASGASLGGVDLQELIDQYGTPLYVMDATTIREAARAYTHTLQRAYPGQAQVMLACKANFNVGLGALLLQEGLGFDVVSAGELATALRSGATGDRILFNGNNKSDAELAMALEHGVGRISLDNFEEIHRLARIARAQNTRVSVLARIAPGIECHTHDYIKTGQNDSKFGFPLARLNELVETVQQYSDVLEFKGLHGHIGSQIFELNVYQDLVDIFFAEMDRIRSTYGLVFEDLDLGGGWGISYTIQDDPLPIETLMETVSTAVQHAAERYSYPLPRLIFEPGRSIMARAGVTLYTAGARKEVEGALPFVSVDGGMGDNIRPALYQAEYTAAVLNKLEQPCIETVRVVGKYCESGDVLLRRFECPTLESGDRLVVFGTGAYNHTMASVYNRFGRPAMVLVENGQHGLLLERENVDALLMLDRTPAWLATPVHA
jgi:diaminopimelate decarboxylase